MKGFLGAFLIFIFWASGGIYYVSKTNHRDSNQKETIAKATSEVVEQLPSLPKEEVADKKELATVDSSFAITTTPNSQILAAELKKSIAISDTVDINSGEPALKYENEISLVSDKSLSTNLFYPRYTNSSDLILDKDLIDYANELKEILEEDPEKKVTIIGHTDNIGNARDNFTVGLKKARQVKWYLTARKGIPRSFITATSRGEEEPIESNNSRWGRNKNNRIEIIVD